MISVKESAILSIDYGERFFGFAIKLINESTIFPLEVIDSKSTDINDVIQGHIVNYDVGVIIVGYPIGLKGNETKMTKLVDLFINNLKVASDIDIHRVDERFSSKLNYQGHNNRVDGAAALVNLETYIKNNA